MYCCTVALLYIIAVSARRFGGRILERVRKVCGVSAAGRPRQPPLQPMPVPGARRTATGNSRRIRRRDVRFARRALRGGGGERPLRRCAEEFREASGSDDITAPLCNNNNNNIMYLPICTTCRWRGRHARSYFYSDFFFRVFIPFRPVVVVFSSVGTNCCSATRSFGDSEHPPPFRLRSR